MTTHHDDLEAHAHDALETERQTLLTDAWRLVRDIIEQDLKVDFDAGQFLHSADNYADIDEREQQAFINQYWALKKSTQTPAVIQAEKETRKENRILATNAWHLARYAIEHAHEVMLPDDFDAGRFLYLCEAYPELTMLEKVEFANQYRALEQLSGDVTARTLVATRMHGHDFWYAVLKTSVGRYLLFLFAVTLGFGALVVIDIADFKLTLASPFYAAGLGTCVYLLRVTQQKLKTREFDPVNIPSHLIRLALGVIAGGSIVMFPDLLAQDDGLEQLRKSGTTSIQQNSVAFLLGYAVEIFYSVLDNIGGRVKNPRAKNAAGQAAAPSSRGARPARRQAPRRPSTP